MTGQPPPGVVTGRPIAEQRAHDAALATVAAVEAAREATPCPTLTVLRGLPGSGKTTLARELRDDARNRAGRPGTLVVISRDDIRQHLIGLSMAPDDAVLDRAGEALVTAIETAIVDACLAAAGVDVVVDATHLDRSHLERWDVAAGLHGAQLDVRDLDVPVEECIRRDAARAAAGGRHVGEDVIRRMAATSAPTYEEPR